MARRVLVLHPEESVVTGLRAHYHVPKVTVQLGTVLDLRVQKDASTRLTIDEWDGWLLLTDENAMDSSRPRLFLVPGELGQDDSREAVGPAAETYERWHRRGYDFVDNVDVSGASIGFCQGRVMVIGYRSDKWGDPGKTHDYDHDFTEAGAQPPLLYTNRAAIDEATTAVIVGGDMRISPRGIE